MKTLGKRLENHNDRPTAKRFGADPTQTQTQSASSAAPEKKCCPQQEIVLSTQSVASSRCLWPGSSPDRSQPPSCIIPGSGLVQWRGRSKSWSPDQVLVLPLKPWCDKLARRAEAADSRKGKETDTHSAKFHPFHKPHRHGSRGISGSA